MVVNVKEYAMTIARILYCYHIRARRRARLAWAGLTLFALVINPSLPITSASSNYRTDEYRLAANKPQPGLGKASAGRIAADALARLPLRFEACDIHAPTRYRARMNESTIYLSATEATLLLRPTAGVGRLGCGADLGIPRNARSPQANEQLPEPRRDRAAPRPPAAATVRMQLVGANRRARVIGEERSATRTNYFIGKDSTRWRSDVPNFTRVKVEKVYPGIDIVYYGSGQQVEYDFKVAPGADLKAIRLRFRGARNVRLDESGDLLIETAVGLLRHRRPAAYQEVGGARKEITARYVVSKREVRLGIADYDKSLPLIIDPVMSYATYFGGPSGGESISQVAFDGAGNAYFVGTAFSLDLPTTPGALQPTGDGDGSAGHAFVAKLNATGTAIIYATYLGGSSSEEGDSIAVDSAGNAYVTGITSSNDFPTTQNAFQRQSPGKIPSHAFVAKLNPTGTALVYSTFLGGPNEVPGVIHIAVDQAGQATVAGSTDSAGFPTTPGARQEKLAGSRDAFIARLNRDGSALIYGTYLGGDDYDAASCIALDASGNAYVAGRSESTNFPTTKHAFRRQKESFDGLFVSKISPMGDRLVYSTFLGGDPEFATGIAVDLNGSAYVTGYVATPNMPTTPGALQPALAGQYDAFVQKLNDTGSDLVYSTFLGGTGDDHASAIAVDSLGQAYVTGGANSGDFPLAQPLQTRKHGNALFKSTDAGSQWDDIPVAPPTLRSLVVDPEVTSTIYGSTYGDILKSTDGGSTWRVVASGIAGQLLIDPQKPAILYAFANQSIYKSADAGAHWHRLEFPFVSPQGVTSLIVDPKATDTLYLGKAFGAVPGFSNVVAPDALIDFMLKSTDGGASWRTLDFGLPVTSVGDLAIDPQVTSTIYASTSQGLLRSTNAGDSWVRIAPSYSRLTVDPTNSRALYAVSFEGVVKSTDGGASWNMTTFHSFGIAGLTVDPQAPSTVYAAGYKGLAQTTDGGASWRLVLDRIQINTIALDPRQHSTVYAGAEATSDVFISKLNAAGTALVYSTYLGGIRADAAASIAVDAYGTAYVAGITFSTDFPVTPGAYQIRGATSNTGFVVRITDRAPLRVTGVTIKGKKLFVSGEGFDRGAVIVVNNADFETENDAATPSVLLISRRGGKQIAPGQTVTIRVRDADGKLSEGFSFTRSAG